MAIVNIKGYNNNLVFVLGDGTFDNYMAYLQAKFESNPQLFNGSQVIFKGEGVKKLAHSELAALQRLCLDYGMVLNNTGPIQDRSSSKDLIVRQTLRSGQKIHSNGSVAVWGDVHESAEITAVKDIIVLGKLGGIAHAGCTGDLTSVVFALNLSPSQIRIGDMISRSPGHDTPNDYPEIAYVDGENIFIKEYNSRDRLT